MNNQDYWARRKAREMYTELQKAEETADELKKVYMVASNEIKQRQAEILRRFMLKHHLTEAQARRLLRTIKNKNDINALIQALKNDPQNADLAAELESQAYAARINRLTQTQIAVDNVAATIFAAALPRTRQILSQVAQSMYYHEMFELQKRSGYAYAVSPLDPKRIAKVLNTRWSGQNFSRRLWGNTERLAGAVKEQILLEILTGKTQHFMSQAIDSRFSVGYNETRLLIRTESNYVTNQMSLEAYKDTGADKYIYVAILDLKTSLVCRGLDKKVFKVSEAQAGKNLPPMHPWCRSTTIAWMPRELLAKMKQRAWNPAKGEAVMIPATMTYEQWYNIYVKGAQNGKGQGS